MTSMMGYRLTFVLPLENIVAALLIAFLTSQLAALLLSLHASRAHFVSHPIRVRQRTQMSTNAHPVVADFCSCNP
jgi:hypothetical protein